MSDAAANSWTGTQVLPVLPSENRELTLAVTPCVFDIISVLELVPGDKEDPPPKRTDSRQMRALYVPPPSYASDSAV
jgi:hypothetical protein